MSSETAPSAEQESSVKTHILDPSDKFRPEKSEAQFRNYTSNNAYYKRVKNCYYQQHTYQTYEFAKAKLAKWTQFQHTEMPIMEAVTAMNEVVDESDPDVDIPNSVHAFQTAERIRQVHPDKEWFQFVGLIHDVGKVMALWGEPQYCVTGDTHPTGCEFSDKIVFGKDSFSENPDFNHPVYSKKLGVYEESCGLDKVIMTWGHDEYLYRVLKNHPECKLPEEGLNMIRFHSFYPWHTSGDYMYLCNNKDKEMLNWVLEFNKFDLYSKGDALPDQEALMPYYESLAEKFLPGKLKW